MARNAQAAIGTSISLLSVIGVVLAWYYYYRRHLPIPYRKICSRIKPQRQDPDRTLSFQIDEPLLPRPTVSSGHTSTFIDPYLYQLPPGASATTIPTVHSRHNTDQSGAYDGIVYDPFAQAQATSTTPLLTTATTVRRVKSSQRLTDTQMESIQSLLDQNVPLGVIANLMETMMNAPEASSSARPEAEVRSPIGPPMYESR